MNELESHLYYSCPVCAQPISTDQFAMHVPQCKLLSQFIAKKRQIEDDARLAAFLQHQQESFVPTRPAPPPPAHHQPSPPYAAPPPSYHPHHPQHPQHPQHPSSCLSHPPVHSSPSPLPLAAPRVFQPPPHPPPHPSPSSLAPLPRAASAPHPLHHPRPPPPYFSSSSSSSSHQHPPLPTHQPHFQPHPPLPQLHIPPPSALPTHAPPPRIAAHPYPPHALPSPARPTPPPALSPSLSLPAPLSAPPSSSAAARPLSPASHWPSPEPFPDLDLPPVPLKSTVVSLADLPRVPQSAPKIAGSKPAPQHAAALAKSPPKATPAAAAARSREERIPSTRHAEEPLPGGFTGHEMVHLDNLLVTQLSHHCSVDDEKALIEAHLTMILSLPDHPLGGMLLASKTRFHAFFAEQTPEAFTDDVAARAADDILQALDELTFASTCHYKEFNQSKPRQDTAVATLSRAFWQALAPVVLDAYSRLYADLNRLHQQKIQTLATLSPADLGIREIFWLSEAQHESILQQHYEPIAQPNHHSDPHHNDPQNPIGAPTDTPHPSDSETPSADTPKPATAPFPYQDAVKALKAISKTASTPGEKCFALVETARLICTCIQNFWKGHKNPDQLIVGGDDLLPLMTLIILRAQIPNLFVQARFMEHFMDSAAAIQQQGYLLATLQTALAFIACVQEDSQEAGSLSSILASPSPIEPHPTLVKPDEHLAASPPPQSSPLLVSPPSPAPSQVSLPPSVEGSPSPSVQIVDLLTTSNEPLSPFSPPPQLLTPERFHTSSLLPLDLSISSSGVQKSHHMRTYSEGGIIPSNDPSPSKVAVPPSHLNPSPIHAPTLASASPPPSLVNPSPVPVVNTSPLPSSTLSSPPQSSPAVTPSPLVISQSDNSSQTLSPVVSQSVTPSPTSANHRSPFVSITQSASTISVTQPSPPDSDSTSAPITQPSPASHSITSPQKSQLIPLSGGNVHHLPLLPPSAVDSIVFDEPPVSLSNNHATALMDSPPPPYHSIVHSAPDRTAAVSSLPLQSESPHTSSTILPTTNFPSSDPHPVSELHSHVSTTSKPPSNPITNMDADIWRRLETLANSHQTNTVDSFESLWDVARTGDI